jgi:hypothetical protein
MTTTSTDFPLHIAESAPSGSCDIVDGAQKAFGGTLPNLVGLTAGEASRAVCKRRGRGAAGASQARSSGRDLWVARLAHA